MKANKKEKEYENNSLKLNFKKIKYEAMSAKLIITFENKSYENLDIEINSLVFKSDNSIGNDAKTIKKKTLLCS